MIRAALLVLALLVGLGAAVLSQTRLYHLRALAPDRLPAWTGMLAEDAGLLRGSLRPGAAGLPGAVLRWHAAAPAAAGLRWQLALTGGGVDITATLLLPWTLPHAEITDIAGTIDIDALSPGGAAAAGLLRLDGGAARAAPLLPLSRLADPQVSGTLEGAIRGAAFDGVPLGEGPVSASMAPLGSWRARFELSGGALEARGEATGRLGRAGAALSLDVTETPDTPQAWKNALSLAGKSTETGWHIDTNIPLAR